MVIYRKPRIREASRKRKMISIMNQDYLNIRPVENGFIVIWQTKEYVFQTIEQLTKFIAETLKKKKS